MPPHLLVFVVVHDVKQLHSRSATVAMHPPTALLFGDGLGNDVGRDVGGRRDGGTVSAWLAWKDAVEVGACDREEEEANRERVDLKGFADVRALCGLVVDAGVPHRASPADGYDFSTVRFGLQ